MKTNKYVVIILMFLVLGCGSNTEKKEKSVNDSIDNVNSDKQTELNNVFNDNVKIANNDSLNYEEDSFNLKLDQFSRYINDKYFIRYCDSENSKYGYFAYFAKSEGRYHRIIFDDDAILLYGDVENWKCKIKKKISRDSLICDLFYRTGEKFCSASISIIDSLNSIIEIRWDSGMDPYFIRSGKYISISSFDSIHVVDTRVRRMEVFWDTDDTTTYYSYFKIYEPYTNRVYISQRVLQPYKEASLSHPYEDENPYLNAPLVVLDTISQVVAQQDTSYWVKAYMRSYKESYFLINKGDLKKW